MNNEEKRFQAAVAAMQATISNDAWLEATLKTARSLGRQPEEQIARNAVCFSDALLAELDRTTQAKSPQPNPDGWIPHRPGNPMPCDEETMCRRKYRSGKIGATGMAGDYSWAEWGGGETEIVAWKPV